jgi:glycosyltransferase involved in cell wall biosynthesis
LGGADFVAGVLARAVSPLGPTLILRTEGSDWERPDWYPETVASVDISQILSNLSQKTRVLYVLIGELSPKRIYNVNSRLCFEMFAEYGARLATQFRLYAYYFCADRSPEGVEAGYPVWFFADLIPHLHAALFDTKDLAETLAARYNLSPELKAKLCAIYTPALTPLPLEPMVKLQIASRAGRPRPRLIWAGRFDRQKRFDILLQIAEQMPDVDFDCWGKAVLDAPPDFSRLPKNVRLNPPFASYDELPLANSDGWIYTSEWDGLPTILIEIAALGVPVTASAVGGVPELIDEDTGWPVRAPEDPKAYVAALREMLGDADLRASKVEALQARIRSRHVVAAYEKRVHEV